MAEENKKEETREVDIRLTKVHSGANEAQVKKVHEMLVKGRRYFGSSGASLTHQVSNPIYKEKFEKEFEGDGENTFNPELARIGLEGERKTTKFLKEWMKDKPEVVLVDSVHVKGYGDDEVYNEETGTFDGGDTDHVLIIGKTVIIIDSKNWRKKRRYSIGQKGDILRTDRPFPGGHVNIVRASRLWTNYLRPHRAAVSSIVIITTEETWVVRDVNWWKQQFRLITLEGAQEFLDMVWESLPANTKGFIDANLVTSIAVSALKPYDVIRELLGDTADMLNM